MTELVLEVTEPISLPNRVNRRISNIRRKYNILVDNIRYSIENSLLVNINHFILTKLHKPYFITNNFRISKIISVSYSYYITDMLCKDILSGNNWSLPYSIFSDEILHSLNIPFIEE